MRARCALLGLFPCAPAPPRQHCITTGAHRHVLVFVWSCTEAQQQLSHSQAGILHLGALCLLHRQRLAVVLSQRYCYTALVP